MAIELRNIYCDESGTHAGSHFVIGGLICTSRRAELIEEKISQVRNSYAHFNEFKWTKIGSNERYINMYKELVAVFVEDRYIQLRVTKFHKSEGWKEWGLSEEERFFKCYYSFLLSNMKPYRSYNVMLDDKTLQKKYRWNSLFFSLKGYANLKEYHSLYGNKNIVKKLHSENSKKSDLLQLTDVLINAVTASNIVLGGKALIRDYVLDNWDGKRMKLGDWVYNNSKR